MKPLIPLLLILAILSVNGGYSITEFLNYLQETGIYEVLVEIKRYLGNDVSIAFCKELFKSNDCDSIVNIYIYIPPGSRPENKKTLRQIIYEYKDILIAAGFDPFLINKKLIKFQLYDPNIP